MRLRAFIQHNFWSKLFSLLLATLIWFYINFLINRDKSFIQNPITNPMTREFVRLPVRVLNRSGDDRVFKLDPENIYVSVTGEEAILRELGPKTFSAFVDLTNMRASHETNQQVRMDIPDGVTVLRIEPRAVNVEQLTQKKVEKPSAP